MLAAIPRFLLCCAVFALLPRVVAAQPVQHGGPHDFDFEFGSWTAHVARLVQGTGSKATWAQYDGTSVVHPMWNGRSNVGELDVAGPAGHIVGMTIRLYDGKARQWRISWANANDPTIGTAMIGGFADGRGLFYDREMLDGKPIMWRFLFPEVSRDAFSLVQSFSRDDGRTWTANWKASFTRAR
jgi:hypothetical protein